MKIVMMILVSGFLAGCASTPEVMFKYYPAKWNTVTTVIQTVGCNKAKTRLVVLNTPSITTTYSSDFNNPFQINIKDLDGTFADSDITMTFTDDGRLKSINQSTIGQGETIVKSAVALATAVSAIKASRILTETAPPLDACETIEKWGGDKPITLSYRATIDSTKLKKSVPLDAAPESKDLYELLQSQLPKIIVDVSDVSYSKSGPSYEGTHAKASNNVVLLTLQKVGSVNFTVKAMNVTTNTDVTVGTARIVVPDETNTYQLPIPKAALFGKQTFSLILSEAGAVTSVGYGKNTGTAGALNTVGAIASSETTAAKAAELKAQADLIAQQQRLVICETKPEQCK